ncbi:ABC-2 type transport system ATP-binding protein [Stackebrandtia albiflava]|uniref:ABC-2 type transport system ATP-binding protein n=1 Tax=Stackebrandtia albiflava TaxID=406432 RepID=A0A562VCX9_9ACTN|nr:ABC transporter ATP-binding protein [Stackebrandtia albiflava]TWJ15722.1 ABC-2 type transport system ATP-binding protein [Stackebrandtia albiflava]
MTTRTESAGRDARHPTGVVGDGPAIEATGLRCCYGDHVAVDGVDLAIAPGELFALLGTNGAGKTTTVETLEGHRTPDEGRVRVLGRDPARHRRALAGEVAQVLQESGFAGDLTVAETLRLWLRLHPRRQSYSDPLTEVDLRHRSDVRVARLSGGERRRLDLALALATGPRILFLDEPTTGMDPASRERTWRLLRRLADDGCTILLTTHYLEEAEELADRLAVMHRGRIAVTGTVAEVAATRRARIHCVPSSGAGRDLPPLAGDTTWDGPALTVRTRHLQADLHRLLDWADRTHVTLNRLNAAEASLREVFAAVQADRGEIEETS